MKCAIHATFVLVALLAPIRHANAAINIIAFDKPVSTSEWTLKDARRLDIHLGKFRPASRMTKTSEVGKPEETRQLGLPAIQFCASIIKPPMS